MNHKQAINLDIKCSHLNTQPIHTVALPTKTTKLFSLTKDLYDWFPDIYIR